MFINRIQELKTLQREYVSTEASLVILYGRRRIGKTSLINHFIKDKRAVYFLATEEAESIQQANCNSLIAEILDNDLMRDTPTLSWEAQIKELCAASKNERIVFVIDEFQYLGVVNKAFPSIFQKLWDLYICKSNVMVILCGSLIAMMVSQTLSYSSPLYGRRTAQIKLKQIPFSYYSEFLPNLSTNQLIEYYAVTGGVPRYVELFRNESNVTEGVLRQVFSPDGFLYEEPTFLLGREVYNPSVYQSILYVVASRTRKMNEITALVGMKRPAVTHHMNTLMDLDLIERIVPVTTKNPEKSKFVEFRLRDNFLQFWFAFARPFLGELELRYTKRVMSYFKEHFIENHVSYVYERICTELLYEFVHQGLLPPFAKVGRWWSSDSEIDIVGCDEPYKQVLFGECKYRNSPMDVGDFYKLVDRSLMVNVGFSVAKEWFILFSKAGFSSQLIDLAKQDDRVLLVHGVTPLL